MFKLLISLLYLSFGITAFSQGNDLATLISLSNSYYGNNDALYYGKLYRINSRLASGHPYFKSQEYTPATLYIRGQTLEQVACRLDLENDHLVAKLFQNEVTREVILSPAAIDSFELNSTFFVNGKHLHQELNFYYERISGGKYTAVKAYEKQFVEIYNQTYPRGRYGETTSKLLLIFDQEVIDISSNKKLLSLFNGKTSEVKSYLRETKLNLKKASNQELSSLFKFLSNIEIHS